MRITMVILTFTVLASGCSHRQDEPLPGAGQEPVWTDNDQSASAATGKPAVVVPVETPMGTVVSVNTPLRFVVLDFTLNALPEIDRRMFLYRDGQKMAEVKITGPIRGQTIAADILQGIAQVGDEVRAD